MAVPRYASSTYIVPTTLWNLEPINLNGVCTLSKLFFIEVNEDIYITNGQGQPGRGNYDGYIIWTDSCQVSLVLIEILSFSPRASTGIV